MGTPLVLCTVLSYSPIACFRDSQGGPGGITSALFMSMISLTITQPGHNGFFLSPSGNQIHMVYHASPTSPGNCDGTRYTAVQMVNWNSDGTPNFGNPRPLSESIPEPV